MSDRETEESLTQKYAGRIREILSQSEIESVSAKRVRSQLELEFNIDLKTCKEEINKVIEGQFTIIQEEEPSNIPPSHTEDTQNISAEINDSDLSDVIDEPKKKKRKASSKKDSKDTKKSGKKTKATRKKRIVDPNAPKPINGFSAPCILSEQLGGLLKAERLPRTEVIKQLWIYIKANKLQDPKDGRNIICDAALKELFQVDEVTSFQMAKFVGPHLTKISPEELQELKDQAKLALAQSNSELPAQ